jgi:hypothetical protein
MTVAFEHLRADLLQRWRAAFGRHAEITAEPDASLAEVYTQYPAYALEGYTPKKFKPGARVSKTASPDADDYVFHRDAKGRPHHVRFAHRVNRLDWRGIYVYGDEAVEHIELCMQTRVVSLYERLALADGAVVAEQRFVCNGGGSDKRLAKLSADEKAARILDDPHAFFIYLTRYHVTEGRTGSADEYHEVAGQIHEPVRTYDYADGALTRIVQHWPGGETRVLFKKRG